MTCWLILVVHLAKAPAYLRVKTWRRLQAIGAVSLRQAAWVLPSNEQTLVAAREVIAFVAAGGGEAMLAASEFVAGISDGEVVATFQNARDRDYHDLSASLPTVRVGVRPTSVRRAEIAAALGRARRQLKELSAVDFFGAPGRESAVAAISSLEHRLIPAPEPPPRRLGLRDLRGKVWVTRAGVHVDRMACAWLIRRHIDARARFRFVPGLGYRGRKNEMRYDMADAEFTHEGDRCSFEVLLDHLAIADHAVRALAEIVHDLDNHDGKYERPETPGVARVLSGIVAAHSDDQVRIERAAAVFDDLVASFRSPSTRSRR